MSKNSMSKTKARQKKKALRKAQSLQKKEKRLDDALMQIVYYPGSLIEEKCTPGKDTIVFKGMTTQIARSFKEYMSEEWEDESTIPDSETISSLESFQSPFPLNDFYAEIQTDTGSKLRMRWAPFEAPVSSADCLLLCRECYYATFKDEAIKRNANVNVRAEVNRISGLDKIQADDAYATIYMEYKGIYTIGYLFLNADSMTHIIRPKHISQFELESKNVDLFKEYTKVAESLQTCAFAIQYIVKRYLNGIELPKLPISGEGKAEPEPKAQAKKHETESHSAKTPTEPKCIAYIRYDASDGKISISNSSREYSMKWWIVSGHRRHYSNGKIVEIPPYIKGDKNDPDAKRALSEFKSGFNRIKYYHLIARKSK